MTAQRSFSSGDLLADRRFAWGRDLLAEGDAAAAADLFAQAVEIAPGWAAGWFALGEAEAAAGKVSRARVAFARALALDPADRFGAGLRIAALGGETPAAMPAAYVAALFDDYAPRFDALLTEKLGYRGPEVLLESLRAVCARQGRALAFGRVLDLGCGTGLMGAAIRPFAAELAGIDLSPAMVGEARRKGIYDQVEVGEVGAALALAATGALDLILAADVFVYLGDLGPVIGAGTRALAPGGMLAFTVERLEGEAFRLGAKLRYAHSEAYLRSVAEAAGLSIAGLEPVSTRVEAGEPVPGLVVVLGKP